jgi:hypothetical protein
MSLIAILSDSHDNLPVLRRTLEQIRSSGATTLIHCGDLCAPFVMDELGKGFPGPIHIVFGNNDADGRLLQVVAGRHAQIGLYGVYAELNVDERAIAVIHYPEPARRIAASGQLDLVCYGHDHRKHAEQVGACWLVNPGELLGLVAAPTWALYDTAAASVTHVDVIRET